MSEIYSFIEAEERAGEFSVRNMCWWADASRSGHYEWKTRDPSGRDRWRIAMTSPIRAVVTASDGTYGYRRAHAALVRSGRPVDPDTVRELMDEAGLVACQPRPKGPRTTMAGLAGDVPDLVERDFTASAPGFTLVGDIAYVRTWQGFAYLATVLDCYSRKAVGCAMADRMRTELVVEALEMAARNVAFTPGETVFHSDRGCQYTSEMFAGVCERLGVRRSMGWTGACRDNAWAESFNGTLKNERCHRKQCPTIERAVADVTRWIELVYNQTRLHSAIGHLTPNEMETAYWAQRTAEKQHNEVVRKTPDASVSGSRSGPTTPTND